MEKENEKTKIERFYEPKCPVTRPVYEWIVDDDGHHIRKQTGEKNFDDEIQLYKDQTDIKLLVERLMAGDPAMISLQKNAVYGDVNDYPEEYHPVAGAQALHTLYENQSDEFKAKFPTYEAFEKFFAGLTAEMVNQLTTPVQEDAVEPQVEANNE